MKKTLRKKCVELAKKKARERDNDTCVRCGRSKSKGYVMHGSHIFPEGTYVSMSADVDNILCLCFHCHFYWWHKNPLDASAWFKSTYKTLYQRLLKRSQKMRVINWEKKYQELKLWRENTK